MRADELLQAKRGDILRVAASHGARNVRVLGSTVRGEAREGSDMDFLMDMEPGRSVLDLSGLAADLRELRNREVDAVTDAGLYSLLRRKILKDAEL